MDEKNLMKVKYNRVSTLQQTGDRFEADTDTYDLVLLDKVSGTVPFKEREKAKVLIKLIEEKRVGVMVIQDVSRLGRNAADAINTLQWLDNEGVSVLIKDLNLYSILPNGKKNPIFTLISSLMGALSQMDRIALLERLETGKRVKLQKGLISIGRKRGSTVSDADFMDKPKHKKCLDYLKKGRTIREIVKICDLSIGTVMKVKKTALKLELL